MSSSLGVQLAVQRVDLLHQQAAQYDATLTSRLSAVQDGLTTAASGRERLTRLVSDLLDLSRVQIGQLAGRLAPADLLAIVRAAVDEQRQIAPGAASTQQAADRRWRRGYDAWGACEACHDVVQAGNSAARAPTPRQ